MIVDSGAIEPVPLTQEFYLHPVTSRILTIYIHAGVANCKILAKLAAGLHKPSQQTVVPASGVQGLLEDLPIPKLRQLGGKLGEEVMRVLNIKTVGEQIVTCKSTLTPLTGIPNSLSPVHQDRH